MITYLRLQNFRRHEDVELHFTQDHHLILVSGKNGAGKTSILEAIIFALYGEGRDGKKHFERLVRRGAELEGMAVELRMEIEGAEYQIIRKRVDKTSSAVLYVNGEPLVESPTGVTAEVTRILGMDVAGFKLAVYAQQRELDGLASLQHSNRRKMIGRLLRLDEVVAARDKARSEYRIATETIRTLGAGADINQLKQDLESQQKALAAQQSALKEARESLESLRGKLADAEQQLEGFREERERYTSAQTEARLATEAVEEAERRLADIGPAPVIPDAPADEEQIRAAERVVTRRLDEMDAIDDRRAQAKALKAQREADLERSEEIRRRLDTMDDLSTEKLAETTAALQAARNELEAARRTQAAANQKVHALEGERVALERRLREAEELGDKCSQCGQDVDPEHHCRMLEEMRTKIAQVEKAMRTERRAANEADQRVAELADTLDQLTKQASEQERALERRKQLESEYRDLKRRLDVYGDITIEGYSPEERESLEEWMGALRAAATLAQRRAQALAERELWEVRRQNLQQALEDAQEAHRKAMERLEAARPSAESEAAEQQVATLREQVAAENELVSALREEVARAEGLVELAAQALRTAEEHQRRREEQEHRALVALRTSEVLEMLRDRLVRSVRPTLEGAVGEVLATMSNGRFTRVRFGDDYEIQVLDDGEFRELEELSGGERDLIALAVRLGLAELVAERHGGGGPGFLILDECFGSQDVERRISILEALRTLRSTYPQIFLVSHVGGIEDECDRVIEVTISEDRQTTDVHDA